MAKVKQSVKKTGKARKELIVAELVERIDKSNGLVFVDYKGLTHIQLENLKKELKTMDSTIVIAKNSLLRLSLEKSKNFADFKDNEGLELPTATLFIQGDMVEPLKKLQKTVKELGLPKIKFAVLEGSLTDEAGVLKIAALPSRETLIAQFVGTLNSPIQGLVVTLNGTIQKFVMTLDAIAKSKPAGAVPSTDGANPAPASEPSASTTETSPSTTEEATTTETSEITNSSDNTSTDNKETADSSETAESANDQAVEDTQAPTEETSEEKAK